MAEYEFLLALDGQRTIEQAREQAAISTHQQHTLSPEQAESLVLWAVGEALMDEHTSAGPTTASGNRSSLAWIKLPLFSRDTDWQPIVRATGWLFDARAILMVVMLWLLACCLLLLDRHRFAQDLAAILAPGGWLTLTIVWLVLKAVHELGHLVCCRRFGGKVGDVGVAWMLLAPVAYVDLTDLYRLNSRWQRVLTCLAGIYIEMIVAAIAVIVWSGSTSPTVCHLLATIAVTASVGSLLFNLNPLMRLDGYHAICDLLDRPNLGTDGAKALQTIAARLFLGRKSKRQTSQTRLAAYGLAVFAYRIVVSIGIVTAAHAMYGRTGLLLMAVLMVSVTVAPLLRAAASVFHEFRHRPVVLVRFSIASTFIAILLVVGWHSIDRWQSAWHGVVEYVDDSPVRSSSAGKVVRVLVESNQRVHAGDALVELENLAIVAARAKAESELASGLARYSRLRDSHLPAEAAAEHQANQALETRLSYLKQQEENLIVRAPRVGTVIALDPNNWVGRWCDEGEALLLVVDTSKKKAIVAIPQAEVQRADYDTPESVRTAVLPTGSVGTTDLLIFETGDGQTIAGTVTRIAQRAELTPPHPALAASAGGPLCVRLTNDAKSALLLSPYLRLEATIYDPSNQLHPGQSIRLRSHWNR